MGQVSRLGLGWVPCLGSYTAAIQAGLLCSSGSSTKLMLLLAELISLHLKNSLILQDQQETARDHTLF